MPPVNVTSKYAKGINSLAELEGSQPMQAMPLDEAITTPFNTDAHFVTYRVPGATQIPRINKPALSSIREQGLDVVVDHIVLDYDNPGHGEWTKESLASFFKDFEQRCDELMGKWRVVYTTLHGARIIFELSEPIPADVAEPKIAGLIARFRAKGIEVDKLSDWTRLFRLPDVNRDGEQQGEAWWYLCAEQEQTVAADEIPSLGEVAEATEHVPLDVTMPDPDEAKELLWTTSEDEKRRVRSEWYRTAKRALSGRSCYRCIFEEAPIARDGERNQTLISYTGQAVSLLHGYPDTEPELVFALFVPAVEQLDGRDGNRSWMETLWHGIKLAWEREDGRAAKEQREQERAEVAAATGKDRLIAGVRSWNPDLPTDPEDAWDWISRRQILSAPSKYFVMRDDGFYHGTPCSRDMIQATVRMLGMAALMDGFEIPIFDKNGMQTGEKTEALPKLLEQHAIVIQSVRGRANLEGGVLTTDATGRTYLEIGLYSLRDDISPEYSADVDEWLHACFGDKTKRVENWIGHSLDFSRPICALSVVGPPSMGKKMLVRGLAECINTRAIADGQEMVDQYQSKITETPFVNVNEGFPIQNFGRSSADNFRRWTSGDPITVNPKFLPTLDIQSPLRIVITANNTEVVRTISLGKTLSIEDRDAIGLRLLHIPAEDRASIWLREKGGYDFTRGWVDSDDGTRGNDVVAKHFLWLHANRQPPPRGNRFLVEGGLDEELIQDMALESGIMPDVVETIIDLISTSAETPGMRVDTDTGAVYVLAAAVVSHHSQIARRGARSLQHRSVGAALRTLKHVTWREGVHRVKDAGGRTKVARWYMLDNALLLRAAQSNGFRTDRLLTLIEQEKGHVL